MDATRFIQGLEAGQARRIFGLGDSLTYGYMVGRGYFQQLLEQLASRYPMGSVEASNQGVCGATAEDGARHLSYGSAGQPSDLLLIQFGLNDAYMGIHAASFQKMVARIISRALDAAPELEIVLVPPPPLDDEREQRLAAPFTEAMHALADLPVVRVADVAGAWGSETDRPLFLMDGVHPSEDGYACMCEAVLRVLTGTTPA